MPAPEREIGMIVKQVVSSVVESIHERRAGMMRRQVAVLALGALLCTTPALAETPDTETSTVTTRHVVSVIDRTAIEMSGLTSVRELVTSRLSFNSFGLYRPYFGTGGTEFLVNGRAVSSLNLNTLPISAVERIEILDEGAVRFGGNALSGAINIVLRHDFEGVEVSAASGLPGQVGGDAEHASTLWGGMVGQGRITIGVDHIGRQEVRDADRDFSRGMWSPGGAFADTQGVSLGGNTVIVGDLGLRPLGGCDENIYTGVLTHPAGEACGYAFADIKWQGVSANSNYVRRGRETLFVNADQPIGDDAKIYAEARIAQQDTAFLYAPSVDTFRFTATGDVRANLIANVEGLDEASAPEELEIAAVHRFLGHGNREWRSEYQERDLTLGVRGALTESLVYDLHVQYYRFEEVESGDTFVSRNLVTSAIESGRYDIVDPLSTAPGHLQAIRDTALRLTHDTVRDYRRASAALEGDAFTMPSGDVHWTSGVEIEEYDWQNVYDYRDSENRFHEATDVLGSGDNSSEGDRLRTSVLAEVSVPLFDGWHTTLGARHDDYDDVGGTTTWGVANRYQLNDVLVLRASWDRSAMPPQLSDMHLREAFYHPNVCDPLNKPVCTQVRAVTGGNPNLKPDETERVSVGATAHVGAFSLAADWFAIEISDTPAQLSAQSVVDLDATGNTLPGTRVERRDGQIDRIVNPIVQAGMSETEGVALRAGTTWETAWADVALDVHAMRTIRSKSWVAGMEQPGDTPRDRVHASLRATWGDVTASWNLHAVSGYANGSEEGRFEGWQGHDLALRWGDAFGITGLRLVGGVLNVGDRGPSTDSSGEEDPALTLDSVRGRTVFLNVTMAW